MSATRFEQVPTWWQQENFKEFAHLYSEQSRPLFFVGSGLSRWAGLPDWASLLRQLARRSSSEVQKEVERLITFNGYQQAGSLLKKSLGEAWRPALNDIFTDPARVQPQSQIHDALVRLRWQRIITTNYDRLLEIASDRIGLTVKTFHYASPELRASEKRDDHCIVHLHGDVMDPNCQLILAKEDYDNLYQEDDSRYYFARTIGGTLRQAQVILFLGYSHDDEYVASLFNRSLEGITDAAVFALVPRKEKQAEFELRLQEQAQKHRIRYISFSREGNYRELLQLLEYLNNPAGFNNSYEWALSFRRPTVVFIRCGGTIGAKSRPTEDGRNLDIDHINSRYDKDLTNLSEKLLKRYRWYSDLPLEIAWEILPPEQQLLSENTVVGDWNNVADKLRQLFIKYFDAPDRVGSCARLGDQEVRDLFNDEARQYEISFPGHQLSDRMFMDGFRNRYVLGFVLLYGTDTLAFLASALSFGLRHIPCPIVITGANQPLFSRNIAGSGEFEDPSDGWRNLSNTLFFLQCFGHHLTEVFVVFGDTIHHGVNLRKRAVDIIPYDREQIQQADLEPFMYRNLSLTGQYMFRLIDGVFCNNYYAATTQDFHRLLYLDGREDEDLWHFRKDLFLRKHPAAETIDKFQECVKYIELAPSFPKIDVSTMLQGESEVRVVLVEGYNSGTYPSVSAHPFSLFLSELDRHGIPVVLVSRYGIRATQEEYKVIEVYGRWVHVLRLYGMVVETALPLLSLVVGRIKTPEWNIDVGGEGEEGRLADHRRQLIRRALDEFFETRRNIISEELKYGTNRADRFRRMTELRDIEEKSRKGREKTDVGQWGRMKRRGAASSIGQAGDLAIIPRADFLNLLDDSVEQFERVGARPDGFLTINSQGFSLGHALAGRLEKGRTQLGYPWKKFFDRGAADQQRMHEYSISLLKDVAERLQASGIVEIEPPALEFGKETRNGRAYFKFETTIRRGEPVGRSDERYAATTFSDQEDEFFAAMHDRKPLYRETESYETELRRLYDQAVRTTWPHITHNLDWFILGFFKGVCCALASTLGFDQEPNAPQVNPSAGRQRALRQSIQCQPLPIDKTRFVLRCRCFEHAGLSSVRTDLNSGLTEDD